MKRFSLISAASIILILIAVLTMPTLAWPDPDIKVYPQENKFGDVELDTSVTTIITIMNIGDHHLTVYAIDFQGGSSPDFTITSVPDLPVLIPPKNGSPHSIEVEITYSPSDEGFAFSVLQIDSNDLDTPLVDVILSGVGVISEPPPPASIANILVFIDASVADGSLVGTGPGKSAVRRLNALRNQIEAAGDLIEDGLIEEACQQLLDAYRKADGLVPPGSPPDFVAGFHASELAVMIQNLRLSLECE